MPPTAPMKSKTLTTELLPARAAVQSITDLMVPFVKKLVTNTGDARVSVTVEYMERNRPDTGPTTLVNHADEMRRLYTHKDEYQPRSSFHPVPGETKHTTDVPCPTCGARPQTRCIDKDNTRSFLITGNGITQDDKIYCHATRIAVFGLYARLYLEDRGL